MATEHLRRDEVLDLLSSRYLANQIYTELGSLTVSINPLKLLPIYSSGVVHSYASPNSLPTHIFSFADGVYSTMLSEKANQAIVISGEPGSGKTEAMKLILQYLTQSKSRGLLRTRNSIDLMSSASSLSVQEAYMDNILQAMVLLQFFSHAQTTQHNNASRCWNWIDLLFDSRGTYFGAKMNALLLDTTQVTKASSLLKLNERNFQIFYLLCEHRAHPRLAGLGLLPAAQFAYLYPQGTDEKQHSVNDFETVDALEMNLKAFMSLGFEEDELNVILRLLAGILHLGNVQIVADETGAGVTIANPSQVDVASKLLQVNPKNLRAALLRPTVTEALQSRDVLAQDIYLALFNELVSIMNRGLNDTLADEDCDVSASAAQEYLTLSLLDVFQERNDREREKSKSFQSLLTHLGNTQLTLHFYQHMFLNEQKAYEQDDIKITHLVFPEAPKELLNELEKEVNQFQATQHSEAQQNYLISSAPHPILHEILTHSLDGHSPAQIARLWKNKSNPREDLTNLLKRLEMTHSHFLRCLRPNNEMKSDYFDKASVMQQLEQGSIFHAVRLKAEGYPYHAPKSHFFHRFQYCLPKPRRKEFLAKKNASVNDLIDTLEVLARENKLQKFSKAEIQIGKNNVFWTLAQQSVLNVLLGPEQNRARIKLQSFLRGYQVRRGNAIRQQTYQKARSLISKIKNYATTDPAALQDLLTSASTNDVRLPIVDSIRQWRLWLAHYHQLLNDLKTVAQNPDSLPAVEGILSRVELEAFFPPAPNGATAASSSNSTLPALTTVQLLLRHSPSTVAATDLRQKEFQEFVHRSPAVIELVNQLVAQRTRLSACTQVIVGLKDALLSDNSEAISRALKLAETAHLESPLVDEARALLSRLSEEQKLVAELRKAMTGSRMEDLEKALDNTKHIALDAEMSAVISNAIQNLHGLYEEHLKTISTDEERRVFWTRAQNYGYKPEANGQASGSKAERKAPPPPPPQKGLFASLVVETEPVTETRVHNRGNSLVQFEEEKKPLHVRVASDGVRFNSFSANSFELSNSPFMIAQRTQLDEAIANRDLDSLHKLMDTMSKSDFSDRSRQVRRAEALAKHLEQEKKIEAAMEEAIQELDQEALRGLLKEAALCGMPVSDTMRSARNICYEIPTQELLELKVENALSQVKEDLSNVGVTKDKINVLLKQMEDFDMKNDYWARKARLFIRAGTPHAHVSFKLNASDKTMLIDSKARRSFSLLPDTSQFADVINMQRNHHPLSKYSGLRDPASFTRLSMFKKPKNVVESMCRYQKKQISSSLTNVPKEKVKICKEIFQNLLGYMKITYHPYPVTLGHAVIMTGMNHADLRDEIYAQLIKQTTYKIPKLGPGAKRKPIVKPGMVHCWVLLYFTINSFLPSSEEMKPVILDHIVASTHLPAGGEFDPIIQYAMHCYAAYNVMIDRPESTRLVPASIDQLRLASDGELEFTQVEMNALELVDKDRTDLEKPVRNKVKAAKIRQYNKEYFTDTMSPPLDVDEKMCESLNTAQRNVRARRNTGGSTLLSPGAAAAAVAQGDLEGVPPSPVAASRSVSLPASPQRNSLLLSTTVPRVPYPAAPASPNQRQATLSSLPPAPSSPNQRHATAGNPPPSPTFTAPIPFEVGELPL